MKRFWFVGAFVALIGCRTLAGEVVLEFVDRTANPPEELAYSRAGKGLFVAGDSLQWIDADQLRKLKRRGGETIFLEALGAKPVVVSEDPIRTLSVPAASPIGAGIGEDDELVVFSTSELRIVASRKPAQPENSIAEAYVSPGGDAVIFLEEIDLREDPLLLSQWNVYSPLSGETRPILGAPVIRPHQFIGWVSSHAAVFKADDGGIWLVEDTNISARQVLLPEVGAAIQGSVASAGSHFFAVTVSGEQGGIYLFDNANPFLSTGRKIAGPLSQAITIGPDDLKLLMAINREDDDIEYGVVDLQQFDFERRAILDDIENVAIIWDHNLFAIARISESGLVLRIHE